MLMFENAKAFNGPKTNIFRDAEHMIKYTTQLRTHFDAGTLFTLGPKAADEATADNHPTHHHRHHRRRKRIGFQLRRARRGPRRPVLALGEFGLKDDGAEGDENAEGAETEEGVEKEEGANGVPATSEGESAQGADADNPKSEGESIQN